MDVSGLWLWLAPRVDPLVQAAAATIVAFALGFVAFIIFRFFGGRFLEQIVVPAARSVDGLLDRIAPLTGIQLEHFWMRWGVYWLVFIGLAGVGALAPTPLGLVAVLAALVAILAIYRQWEHDETERRMLEDAGDTIPFRNDYRNELLISLVVMMGFFALGFARLEELYPLYAGDPHLPLASTAMFIWGEFLKAVPLVDASEIYGWRNISGLEASGGVGRSATFILRVVFDLVIIAALIRMVDIIRRITSGLDLRQIERDLATGNAASINAAIAKLAELALRGRMNALRALTDIALARRRDTRATDQLVVPGFGTFSLARRGDGRVTDLDPRERAALALLEVTERRGDIIVGLVVVESLLALSRLRDRETRPADWANTQNNLGASLRVLGTIALDPARLEAAIEAYRSALEVRTREASPAAWAMTQNNLGVALKALGEMAGNPAHLEAAVQAYHSALEVRTRPASPAAWAATQNNLGNALLSLGEMAGDPARLEEAVQAYHSALEVRTRAASPAAWAMTQNNLGRSLLALGELAADPNSAEEAIAAFRKALEVYTDKNNFLEWLWAHNNLGLALRWLGAIERDPTRLQEAIDIYRNALKVCDRDTIPVEWARAQHNLGLSLLSLGDLTEDPARLEEAVQACDSALEVFTREASPADWAMTQNNLGRSLLSLGGMVVDSNSAEAAITAFRNALEVYTREASPANWAMTQNNLGVALVTLGEMAGDPAHLEAAVQAYHSALEVRTRAASPANWAMTQNNLGNALQTLGEMASDPARLEEAKAIFEELAAFRAERGETEEADAARERIRKIEGLMDELHTAAQQAAASD